MSIARGTCTYCGYAFHVDITDTKQLAGEVVKCDRCGTNLPEAKTVKEQKANTTQ